MGCGTCCGCTRRSLRFCRLTMTSTDAKLRSNTLCAAHQALQTCSKLGSSAKQFLAHLLRLAMTDIMCSAQQRLAFSHGNTSPSINIICWSEELVLTYCKAAAINMAHVRGIIRGGERCGGTSAQHQVCSDHNNSCCYHGWQSIGTATCCC
jgi:hypothetical protein